MIIIIINVYILQRMMEDPFLKNGVDNVRLEKEFTEMKRLFAESYESFTGNLLPKDELCSTPTAATGLIENKIVEMKSIEVVEEAKSEDVGH